MIIDSLDNASRYFPLHTGFEAAFQFLKEQDLTQLKDGANDVAGEQLSAMVVRDTGRGKAGAKFEAHRRYIDIHYTLSGADDIGWKNQSACTPDSKGYMIESDDELYSNSPSLWTTVPEGHFVIFFPEDAHAPMGTDKAVQKVVVKVAVDWNDT